MIFLFFCGKIAIHPGNNTQTLKKIFIKGDFDMTKVKDQLTREKAIEEIFTTGDLIDEYLPKISLSIHNYPDTWIDSLNKNFASFLVYCRGIEKKFNEEIKPNLK